MKIVHKSGKKHLDADALSRYPVCGGDEDIDEENDNYVPLCTLGLNTEPIDLSKVSEAQRSDVQIQNIIDQMQSKDHQTAREKKQLGCFTLLNHVLCKRRITPGGAQL